MKTVRIIFKYEWYCKNCNENNVVIMDEGVVNIQYYKTVKCYCCGKEYKTKFSFCID